MSFPFQTLSEFIAARQNNLITFSDWNADELRYEKLLGVLKKTTLGRYFALKRWLKEVAKYCNKRIKLKLHRSLACPYMRESGEIGLGVRDFKRGGYLFFAIAHETAHFILMRQEDYGTLKSLDGQYPESGDKKMLSPVEYCANRITLKLFERCAALTKKAKEKEVILRCIDSLKGQLEKAQ